MEPHSVSLLRILFMIIVSVEAVYTLSARCELPTSRFTGRGRNCPNFGFRWTYSKVFKKCVRFFGCPASNDNNFDTERECERVCNPPRIDACAVVRCAECHDCQVNSAGRAKCVYSSDCCPANVQRLNCFVRPCFNWKSKCPNAFRCVDTYCSGCTPRYYDDDLNEMLEGECSSVSVLLQQDAPCSGVDCGECRTCVPQPKTCIRAPCPQHTCRVDRACEERNRCAVIDCKPGYECKRLSSGQIGCVRIVSADLQLKICSQPSKTGPCKALHRRWYYDRVQGRCIRFIYGGCRQNDNNFNSEAECLEQCQNVPQCPIYRLRAPPQGCEYEDVIGTDGCPKPTLVCPVVSVGETETENPGSCPLSFGSKELGVCASDCETDGNCTETEKCCRNGCGSLVCTNSSDSDSSRVCRLPMKTGPCEALIRRWYFDYLRAQCRQFDYGGCDANENNFLTEDECQARCSGLPPCPTPRLINPPPGCAYNQESGQNGCPIWRLFCTGGLCASTICPNSCDVCVNTPDGSSQFRCDRNSTCEADNPCAVIRCGGGSVCRVGLGRAECVASGSGPRRNPPSRCLLPKVVGPCRAAIQSWHYDQNTGTCRKFSYGGCRGNENRFKSQKKCNRICIEQKAAPPVGCRYEDGEDDAGCPTYTLLCSDRRGFCPAVSSGTFGICIESCSSDRDCRGRQKCCSNGCGHTCQNPVFTSDNQPECLPKPIARPPRGCHYESFNGTDGCPDHRLVCESVRNETCSVNSCGPCERCIPEPKVCIRSPCPQYRCEGVCGGCESCVRGRCVSQAVPCRNGNHDPCRRASCPGVPGAKCVRDTCNCYRRDFLLNGRNVTHLCRRRRG